MGKVETRSCRSRAHPSLALAKYWGKRTGGINIPATTSVAVTLEALTTTTTVQVHPCPEGARPGDRVMLDGEVQEARRFRPFFEELRAIAGVRSLPGDSCFTVDSMNDFPTAAGLASSASGFAALATAALAALSGTANPEEVSRLARIGSGSACRSVYGGFTRWEAGSERAVQVRDETWWPDFRVVVLPVTVEAKAVTSREGMNRTRDTSPFYDAWVGDAPRLAGEVERALEERDLERLGTAARLSYLRMFATMLGAEPPLLYWLPRSVEIIRELARLRSRGIPAWETMDAGPQVKVLTDRIHAPLVVETFSELLSLPAIVSGPGPGASVESL
ncbi:MAG: diphosphomevalonate decarboxylase [Spirochaetaceae bacterium]|nr:MAG: diphosphomevalonate decarboxylase [Spirochaetaceae bacterium]